MGGVFGIRLDIFVIVWFIGMGMVNYLDAETGVFNTQYSPKYNLTDIAGWQGIDVGHENETIGTANSPRSQPSDSIFQFLDTFVYVYKAATFVGSVLWNATFGLHTFLRDTFGIPYLPWGLPIMIMVNIANFLGLMEIWAKIKG
jgi:hypothetical protein